MKQSLLTKKTICTSTVIIVAVILSIFLKTGTDVTPQSNTIIRIQNSDTSSVKKTSKTTSESSSKICFSQEYVKNRLTQDESALVTELSQAKLTADQCLEVSWWLADHFGPRHRLAETLELLEALRGTHENILFERTAIKLLSEYSSEADPRFVMEYLQNPLNAKIALLADTQSGMQMMVGTHDPESTVRLLDTLPAFKLKTSMKQGAYLQWLVQSEHSLYEHLNTLPPSPEVDPIYQKIVRRRMYQAPESIMTWAQQITHPETRDRSMIETAYAWKLVEPNTFTEWVETLESQAKSDTSVAAVAQTMRSVLEDPS